MDRRLAEALPTPLTPLGAMTRPVAFLLLCLGLGSCSTLLDSITSLDETTSGAQVALEQVKDSLVAEDGVTLPARLERTEAAVTRLSGPPGEARSLADIGRGLDELRGALVEPDGPPLSARLERAEVAVGRTEAAIERLAGGPERGRSLADLGGSLESLGGVLEDVRGALVAPDGSSLFDGLARTEAAVGSLAGAPGNERSLDDLGRALDDVKAALEGADGATLSDQLAQTEQAVASLAGGPDDRTSLADLGRSLERTNETLEKVGALLEGVLVNTDALVWPSDAVPDGEVAGGSILERVDRATWKLSGLIPGRAGIAMIVGALLLGLLIGWLVRR